jgi:hypothetical protein
MEYAMELRQRLALAVADEPLIEPVASRANERPWTARSSITRATGADFYPTARRFAQ